ncbi:Spondin-2, partial [Acipenser ruthenus]
GCSHCSEDVIWVDGALASPGMRAFVEEGDPEILEQELTAPEARTLHCFQTDALHSAEGQQSTRSQPYLCPDALPPYQLFLLPLPTYPTYPKLRLLATASANITEQNRVTYKSPNITADVIYDLENMVKQESPKPDSKGIPLDWKVSDWSPWSLCSHTCGNGLHQKTQYVLLQPHNDGKPCPVLLQQQKCEELQCPPKQLGEPPTSGALNSTVGNNTDLPSAVDLLPQNGTLVFNGSLEGSNDKKTAMRGAACTHTPLDVLFTFQIPYTHTTSPSHQNVILPIHNSCGCDTQNPPAMLVTPPVITSFKKDSQP